MLTQETMPSALFPQPAVIRFAPQRHTCLCGGGLAVQKTQRKKVLSMIGPFFARETVCQCSVCSRTFRSDVLLRLVSCRCNVAYDVLVHVGQALFQRHRTTEEVRTELAARNVHICASEVAYLGRKFITYLALGHRRAMPRIRQAMKLNGGYVLHLDATHDGDAPALMTGIDSLSSIVLANVKIPSEHSEHIAPFLRKLETDYGTPCACVHDMGLGIISAVEQVFPGVRDFICHFHFLRDIGKDVLEPAYNELRKRLRHHATSSRLHALVREMRQLLVQNKGTAPVLLAKAISGGEPLEDPSLLPLASAYALALWVLQGKHSGDGYGFPFDRPLLEFTQRLLELDRNLAKFMTFVQNNSDQQALKNLAKQVRLVADDPALCHALEQLRWRAQLFDRLREAMRIAPPGGSNGLNDDGTAQTIASIRQGVEQFRRNLDEDNTLSTDLLCRKMADQIDKYGDKLFADPIEVQTPNGPVIIYPQRTNNLLEQFFRGVRRGHRRKTGNNSLCRTLQTMLADTPLVKNLENPAYLEILLDGKTSLVELFADLTSTNLDNATDLQMDTGRILPGFRALLNLPSLPDKVIRLFSKQSQFAKSN